MRREAYPLKRLLGISGWYGLSNSKLPAERLFVAVGITGEAKASAPIKNPPKRVILGSCLSSRVGRHGAFLLPRFLL